VARPQRPPEAQERATISQAVAVGIMLDLVTPTTPAAAAAALDRIEDSLLLAD
jgi:hypothetical protein